MVDEETVVVETVTPKTTRARARQHEFFIDKPSGTDRAPMASEYFLASLCSCHITTAHKVAEKRRLQLDRVRIVGKQWIEGDLLTKIHLDVEVTGKLTRDELETVFRLTERICTISQATKVPVERTLRLV